MKAHTVQRRTKDVHDAEVATMVTPGSVLPLPSETDRAEVRRQCGHRAGCAFFMTRQDPLAPFDKFELSGKRTG